MSLKISPISSDFIPPLRFPEISRIMSDETKTEGAGHHDPEDLETEGYKGQLISECLFDVINFQKNQRKT